MSDSNFPTIRTTTISTIHQRSAVPFDPTLKFNQIIDQRRDDPLSIIRSINVGEFLKVLDGALADTDHESTESDLEGLRSLSKITLACRPVKDGVGIWDTLFNGADRQQANACVVTACLNYTPIPQNRVMVSTPFLNFSLPTTRIFLNEAIVGDKVGVGIYDNKKLLTYVLVYQIDSICSVTLAAARESDNPTLIPAVNCVLDHIARIDHQGAATVIDLHEDKPFDEDLANPFVEHITNSLYNVAKGYPWKPHFIGLPINVFDRKKIETRLVAYEQKATKTSYDEFLEVCRRAYRNAKPPRDTSPPPSEARRRPRARDQGRNQSKPEIYIPQVEIFTKGDYYIATLDDRSNPDCQVFMFPKSDLGKRARTEIFLSNSDLAGVNLKESRKVVVLSPGKFGDEAYLRYFEITF